MLNISNPDTAARYDKYIKALHKEFGSRLFTRKEFDAWRENLTRHVGGIYRLRVPCLDTFLDSHIIHVESKENFSRAYVIDRWHDREFINTAELKKLREAIESCANEILVECLSEAIDDNVQEMDCVRHYYKIDCTCLADYLRQQQSFLVDLVGGTF